MSGFFSSRVIGVQVGEYLSEFMDRDPFNVERSAFFGVVDLFGFFGVS